MMRAAPAARKPTCPPRSSAASPARFGAHHAPRYGLSVRPARTLIHAGVSRDRICIDPPGFGKSANEDIVIQRETAKMASLGYPLMCAVSRKRFVGAVSGVTEAAERDAATFGVCLGAIRPVPTSCACTTPRVLRSS